MFNHLAVISADVGTDTHYDIGTKYADPYWEGEVKRHSHVENDEDCHQRSFHSAGHHAGHPEECEKPYRTMGMEYLIAEHLKQEP